MLAAQRVVDVQRELMDGLTHARTSTDELFRLVKPNALYERPIPERHRIIFYRGHLEAFDWNLLRERVLGFRSFHPEFDQLFAFGIDPVLGGLPRDQASDWPSIAEVEEYVNRVRQSLDEGLERALRSASGAEGQGQDLSPSLLLHVAIEHRQMHAETLAYMLHQLPFALKHSQPSPPEVLAEVDAGMIEIPGGRVTLGLPRGDDGTFGWDNEYEMHTVEVPSFAIDKYKVTNRQFMEFVNAGGYDGRAYWAEADWNWKVQHNISHPIFWKRIGNKWRWRTMFCEIPLPLDWPVYVSKAEADAYGRWAGKSLPTEAQWHRAAYGTLEGGERRYPWGAEAPDPRRGNFDSYRWDPRPVNACPGGQSAFGVADMLGNGWEWTSTLFSPFPGFEAFSFYPGYSADFFDGQHYVIKGGSSRTARSILRRSFRNWFQPHYQYVYAGFRSVSN